MRKLLLALFNHERYQTLSVIAVAILVITLSSCTPKCHSILTPTKQINQLELEAEVEILNAKIQTEFESLEQQAKLKQLLFDTAKVSIATGSFDPMSAATAVIGLLGGGAMIDNARKRKIIKQLEKPATTPTTP